MHKKNFIQRYIRLYKHGRLLKKIHTPLDEAIVKITNRRNDPGLVKEVNSFLDKDIPSHFKGKKPIFYLSRYVATPDYETLLFIKQVKDYDLPIIIGEDTTDILTSHSSLKRNLLKLPIITGESKDGSGILQYERIADLNAEQGKALRDVQLLDGTSLIDFHGKLVKKFLPKNVKIVDESKWVDEHSRGKLVQLYEYLMALLITNGIMLEYYEPDEVDFLNDTVLPAYNKTVERFGHEPLLVRLEQEKSKKIIDYNSYPKSVKDYLDSIK